MFNALESIQAFESGSQARKRRDQEDAYKSAGNALAMGDYGSASKSLYSMGDLQGGMQLAQYGQQQEQMSKQQQLQTAMAFAQNAMQIPQEQRGEWAAMNWDQVGAAFPGMTLEQVLQNDPMALSDQSLQGDLAAVRTALGQMPEAPKYESKTDAFGRPVAFNPATGEYGEAYGGVKPETTNGIVFDPTNPTETIADYRTPSQTGEMTDYEREQLALEREKAAAAAAAAAEGGSDAYGLTPVYGIDENGNRVILQTSKSGKVGMPEIPDGIKIESPYDRSYATTSGREDAKKDIYKTAEGIKVLAAEDEFARLSSQIDDAISMVDDGNTGLFGQFKPSPDLDAMLETIEASAAFNTLVDLKSQGGTLGALSDTELNLLKAKIANVRRSQSKEQMEANLEILRLSMANSLARLKQAYEAEYGAGGFEGVSGGGRAVGPSGQPVPEGFE